MGMSIWGKIIGGTAGFALGGPMGALVGALVGHTYDVYAASYAHDQQAECQAAFSIALIALSAKMAKADGVVTRSEILAFREKVDIPRKDIDTVSRIWEMARRTPDGFEGYASQVARLFPAASAVLEELMGLLFHIARANGRISDEEADYLRKVAVILGFDDQGYERLAAIHGDEEISPWRVLGLDPSASDDELRKAWLALVARHHPDRLIADGLPQECIKSSNDRLARINAAYETICQQRKAS